MNTSRSLFKMVCLLIGFCVACPSAYAGFAAFDYPGSQNSGPACISNNGLIGGVYALDPTATHYYDYYIYDPTRPEGSRFSTFDLNGLPDYGPGVLMGINNSGTVVGSYGARYLHNSDGHIHGFIKYSGQAPIMFDYPTADNTWLSDIDDNGVIAGTYNSLVDPEAPGYTACAFLYDPSRPEGERFRQIAHPEGYSIHGFRINNNGLAVGAYAVGLGRVGGFIYDIETGHFEDLPPIPGHEGALMIYPLGINDSNVIVGLWNEEKEEGYNNIFLYDPSKPEVSRYTVFVDEPAPNSTPTGINNDGVFVGFYTNADGIHGFIYTPESTTTCDEDDTGAIDIVGQAACSSDTNTIRVPIRIQNAYKPDPRNAVHAFGFEVTYNPAVLTFEDFERGELLAGFDDVVNVIEVDHNEVASGVVRIGGFTTANQIRPNQQGILGYLVFTSSSAVSTRLDIQNMVDDIANWPASGGCLTPATGDINLDGEVTPADALCAFEKAMEICDTTCGPCITIPCDVNGDCLCQASDALCIFNKYIGLPNCLD